MSDLKKVAQIAMSVASEPYEKVAWMIGGKEVDKETYLEYARQNGLMDKAKNKVRASGSAFHDDTARMVSRMTPGGKPRTEEALKAMKGTKTTTPTGATLMEQYGKRVTDVLSKNKRVAMGLGGVAGAGALAYGVHSMMGEKAASLNEVAMAKTAAAEMYEDALQKLAFAQSLWAEADEEFVKIASDNGVGDSVGIGDQQTAVGSVTPVGDPTTMEAGQMSPGALNAFVEQLRKQRALGAMPQ